jgi:signal transduction histidine kinase
VADSRPGELRSAVEGVAGSGQEALAALRQVVRVLRVPTGRRDPLESGDIENALSTTVERVRDAGVDVSTRFSVPPTLSDVAHAAVVRIVQESLTNVMLHSAAETAVVEVETHGSDVRIRVSDDGPRRERFPGLQNGGSGIPSMTERARALGGELVAGPAPGGSGWVVIASVPARLDVSQGPAT